MPVVAAFVIAGGLFIRAERRTLPVGLTAKGDRDMKRLATALCALSLTVAVTSAAFAECPAHASKPAQTDVKGT